MKEQSKFPRNRKWIGQRSIKWAVLSPFHLFLLFASWNPVHTQNPNSKKAPTAKTDKLEIVAIVSTVGAWIGGLDTDVLGYVFGRERQGILEKYFLPRVNHDITMLRLDEKLTQLQEQAEDLHETSGKIVEGQGELLAADRKTTITQTSTAPTKIQQRDSSNSNTKTQR